MSSTDPTTITNPEAARPFTQDEIKTLPAVIYKAEVARIARISERTVTREAAKGNLDGAFRIGSRWRFNTDAVCAQFGLLR